MVLMPNFSIGLSFLPSLLGLLADGEQARHARGRKCRRPAAPPSVPAAPAPSARLTATVDLPTPPLPLATAMMLRRRRECLCGAAAAGGPRLGRHDRAVVLMPALVPCAVRTAVTDITPAARDRRLAGCARVRLRRPRRRPLPAQSRHGRPGPPGRRSCSAAPPCGRYGIDHLVERPENVVAASRRMPSPLYRAP